MKSLTLPLIFAALVFTSCSPTDYAVEREITIDAPAGIVFDQINAHKNRDAWSPWEAMDPNMTKNYEGPEAGVGAIYKWTGNDSVGSGTLEITESTPPSHLRSTLTFTEPMESHSTVDWAIAETPEGTRASWTISGELPGYLFWMDQSDMEASIAPDLETGLENLKRVAEEKAKSAQSSDLTAELVTVESKPYFYIVDETAISELDSEFFGSRFGALMKYLGNDTQNMIGMPFSIYQKWDQANDLAEVEVAVACKSDKAGNDRIKKGTTYAGEAMKCVYKGPYEETGKAHEFLYSAIEDKGYRIIGAPWEVFANDPQDVSGSDEYITEVYYPVQKKG